MKDKGCGFFSLSLTLAGGGIVTPEAQAVAHCRLGSSQQETLAAFEFTAGGEAEGRVRVAAVHPPVFRGLGQ